MNLRFPMPLYEALWDEANKRGCSIKVLIVDILMDFIRSQEDK